LEYGTESTDCQKHVSIDRTALAPLAQQIRRQQEQEVVWDEEARQYKCRQQRHADIRNERTAAYILALDAINFCFWRIMNSKYY